MSKLDTATSLIDLLDALEENNPEEEICTSPYPFQSCICESEEHLQISGQFDFMRCSRCGYYVLTNHNPEMIKQINLCHQEYAKKRRNPYLVTEKKKTPGRCARRAPIASPD